MIIAINCGICGSEVHRTIHDDHRHPEDISQEAERACHAHLRSEHAFRYRLWRRVGWKWLVKGIFG